MTISTSKRKHYTVAIDHFINESTAGADASVEASYKVASKKKPLKRSLVL